MLYLTTYYFVKDAPIYMLVVAYLFWKTSRERVQLRGFGIPELDSAGEIYLTSAERERLSEIISEYGNGLDSNERRTAILRTLAERLDVDLDAIIDSRVFNPVTSDEVVDMAAAFLAEQLQR